MATKEIPAFVQVGAKALWIRGYELYTVRILKITGSCVDIEYKGDTGFIYTTSVNPRNLRETKEA